MDAETLSDALIKCSQTQEMCFLCPCSELTGDECEFVTAILLLLDIRNAKN